MYRFAIVVTILVGMVVAAPAAKADHDTGPFGLGIIIGEPTGVSAKLFLSGSNAIDAAVAWSLSGNNNLQIQADYLYHRYELIKVSKGQLPVFFGIGGRFALRDNADDILGIRIPVGIAYEFANHPFDLFGEIVPIFDITPDTDFDLEGAIGARYYF